MHARVNAERVEKASGRPTTPRERGDASRAARPAIRRRVAGGGVEGHGARFDSAGLLAFGGGGLAEVPKMQYSAGGCGQRG